MTKEIEKIFGDGRVSDEEQALFIKNKFLNDSGIYSEIIDLLTK